MKHTPGPWEFSGGGIWGKSPFNARVRLADITFHNSINGIDSNGNGLLMALAPDLFKVFSEAVDVVNLMDDTRKQDSGAYQSFHRLEAAIAKVTRGLVNNPQSGPSKTKLPEAPASGGGPILPPEMTK